MRIEAKFLVFSLAAVVSVGHLAAREPGPRDPSRARFSFLPPARCDQAPDARQCVATQPKAWSAEEERDVRDAMRRLAAIDLVQGLLVAARENGYDGFRRYMTDTKDDPTYGPVGTFNPGFVLFDARVIGLTDAYFQTASVRDALSDYRYGDLILVHELAHAFDDRRASNEPGFKSVTGWVFQNDRWAYTHRVRYPEYLGVYADTLTLYASGRYSEAWRRDRSFATSMKFPLPTIQSLASPRESYADILAHLIVDPRATTYLKPEVVQWFDQHAFPVLVEKARLFKAADYDLF
jgi:hypothetical protein